jgi:rod shape-determining protein MreD
VSAFAFGQGLLIDPFSGGLQGLHAFLYLAVMAWMYLGSRFFDLQTPAGQVFLISSAVLLKKIMFFLLLMLFSQKIMLSDSYLLMSALSIICTGLITPILFYLFNRLRSIP